ncbi:MAG: hypothetical protein II778_03115, partial [Anaerovibrio sp.]|nr:hypothetical protein [Anaerovibrio sp.]
MKKFLSKVLPISLAAVLVLGLIPSVGVKAANVIPVQEVPEGLDELPPWTQTVIYPNDENPFENPDPQGGVDVARLDYIGA